MRRRRSRKRAATIGIAVAVLIAVELIARLAGAPEFPQSRQFVNAPEWRYPEYIARDAELFWRYRPNQVITDDFFAPGRYTINAFGLRNPGVELTKPDGVIRVLCLGGSTTFGWGVDDGMEYPRQLESRLHDLDPQRRQWQVVNAGVTNYSTFQGLRLAQRLIPEWQPDIVLFNFAWGDLQPAGGGVPDREIIMPSPLALRAENLLMHSAAAQHVMAWARDAASDDERTPAHTVWRVDATNFIANAEKMLLLARGSGARAIWVTSPISWPPPGQSDSTGIFHYHHRYHRAAIYAASLGGGELAELANQFNLYRNLFDDPATDIEHFNADGHNFAGEFLARFILGLPVPAVPGTRSANPESSTP
jgi:hypothetical protein